MKTLWLSELSLPLCRPPAVPGGENSPCGSGAVGNLRCSHLGSACNPPHGWQSCRGGADGDGHGFSCLDPFLVAEGPVRLRHSVGRGWANPLLSPSILVQPPAGPVLPQPPVPLHPELQPPGVPALGFCPAHRRTVPCAVVVTGCVNLSAVQGLWRSPTKLVPELHWSGGCLHGERGSCPLVQGLHISCSWQPVALGLPGGTLPPRVLWRLSRDQPLVRLFSINLMVPALDDSFLYLC